MKNALLIFLISFISVSPSIAQSSTESLDYLGQIQQANSLFSNFDKLLDTYYLSTGFNLSGNFSKLSLGVFENFRSTLFKSTTQSIRDEQYLTITGKYQLADNYNLGISANNTNLSDDRNTLLNKIEINYLTLFSEVQLTKNILISPFGGYSTNLQVGEDDNGPVYGFEGAVNNLSFPDFTINSIFKFRNEDILPRRNLLRYFDLSVNNPFNPSVTNLLSGRFTSSRKDFYFPADSIISSTFDIVNNIESRTETNYFAEDKLRYRELFSNIDFEISGSVNWRTIDRDKRYKSAEVQSPTIFDTNIEELILSLGSTLFYRTGSLNSSLSFNFGERDEKHITQNFEGADPIFYEQRSELESRKNNNSTRATIAYTGDYDFSRTDKLLFSLYYNKLRYDTPSEDNDDDRDEILSIARLRYSKNLSPYFQAFINTEATLSHVVYLFASRSSNNNINRVLRLAAGGYYQGANVSSLNTFEVSANYTVYDFEDLTSSLRSISFRQFIATDSSRISLSKRFAFVITGYIKLSEQADLNWGEFAERPSRFLQEIFAVPKIMLTYNSAWFGIGLRYFSLNTFKYDELTRIPDTKYLSYGPLVEIIYNVYGSLNLLIDGWYEFISINNVPDRERANFVMKLNWNF
ncbi:MAG: hypothetical protein IH784_05690 [Bacteroidetes bacterium]|nr:hypothetical protein [Bacteroidota bacterium]